MKKGILALAALAFAFSMYAKDIQELVVTTNPPMSCNNCEQKIKNNIRFEKGVKKITTNIPEQRVVVTYDADKTCPQNIEQAFEKIGYKVEVIESNAENKDSAATSENCEQAAGKGACCK